MPIKHLGKWLFPRLPAWEARRRAKTIIVVLLTAILFAGALGTAIYFINGRR